MSDHKASSPARPEEPISHQSRFLAAWWGSHIGDALAMPTHWYYKRTLIPRDYGEIDSYLSPRNPHPDSILWRSHYETTGPKDDILGDQGQYWGKPGIHYHQFLEAGENTLNVKISSILARSLIECRGYDQTDYLERYTDFMLQRNSHNDTYIEEYHRGFFKNYGRGKAPEKCAVIDGHVSCLTCLTPLILFYHDDRKYLLEVVRKHLSLSHRGEEAAKAGELYAEILHYLMRGEGIEAVLFDLIGQDRYRALCFPHKRWISNHSDDEVVGKFVSSACYLQDALPAIIYLALKYDNAFEKGLLENVKLGGDNCHRGVALGAILGASNGCETIPERWISGLKDREGLVQLGNRLWETSCAK